jgi:hypothetical protein
MVGTRVRIEGGFIDGDSKSAWLAGAIEPGAFVPSAVSALLPPRGPARAQTVLTITDCVPMIAVFRCDRGPRGLPAYRLSVTGLRGFCLVVSPNVECWWPARESEWRLPGGGTATVDEDGLTIHFPAFGGALTEFHRAEFQEHSAYVVGRAITSKRSVPPDAAVRPIGINRTVIGRLAAPLGRRVLVSAIGTPLAVTATEMGRN